MFDPPTTPPGDLVDDTGQVTVTVDDQGRVTNLRIGAQWRDHLTPEEVGRAVVLLPLTAQLENLTVRLREMNDRRETPQHEPARRLVPVPPAVVAQARAELDDIASTVWDDIRRVLDTPSPVTTTTVTDRHHHVSVTVSGGRIDSVVLEPQWAQRAARHEIAEDVTEALHAAYADIDAAPGAEESPVLRSYRERLDDIRSALGGY